MVSVYIFIMFVLCENTHQMEWSNAKVMKFLELYQMHPCIWDPKHSSHKVKSKVNDAWADIRDNMEDPECSVRELKKKKDSLMSMYRGYKTKVKKSQLSCTDASQVFNPTWFAYEFMDAFLSGIYKCSLSMQMEEFNEYNNEQNTELLDDSVCEDESITLEEERPAFPTYQVLHQTPTIIRKRQRNPSELQQSKTQMEQVYNVLQNGAQSKHNEEDEECSIFGKLVAKKLSKIPEDRRDLMMIKISQLLYDERLERECNRQSSSTIQSYPYTPSPLPAVDTQQENIIPQVVTTKQTPLRPTVEITCKPEPTDLNNFSCMNFEVDHTATQSSNLNKFVNFMPKQ